MKELIHRFIDSINARFIYPSLDEIEMGDDPDRVKRVRSYGEAFIVAVLHWVAIIVLIPILLPFMILIAFLYWLDN